MSVLDELDAQQKMAATTINGPVLILAGAGTGKTRTLMARTAYMLQEGIAPENILLLTFTNKAARELKNRLIEATGSKSQLVTASTFHSFCLMCFRKYCKVFDFPAYRVIDTDDDKVLLRHVMQLYQDEIGVSKQRRKEYPTVNNLLNCMELAANKCESVEDTMQDYMPEHSAYFTDCLSIIEKYMESKKAQLYLNFTDILTVFLQYLREIPDFCNMLADQFPYIMCDEYQDTNLLQDLILSELSRAHNNLCVVGDDNQSIYRFRAANIENILNFESTHPGCTVIKLTENYRSSQEILDVSNCMMTHAEEGIKKTLHGQIHGDKPMLVSVSGGTHGAEWILRKAAEFQKDGVPLSHQAVLVRNALTSAHVETLCLREKVPFRKYGGRKFIDGRNVKMIMNFLHLDMHEKDILAWRAILSEYPGVGPKSVDMFLSNISVFGVDVLIHPRKYITGNVAAVTAIADFPTFWDKLKSCQTVASRISVIRDYYTNLLERQIMASKSNDRVDDLTGHKTDLKGQSDILMDMADDITSTRLFLDSLSLEAIEAVDNREALVISTIHSAKGLEWDVVYFLCPAAQFFEEHCRSLSDVSEERRVMYVALTRAKKYLFFVHPDASVINGQLTPCQLSDFLLQKDVLNTICLSNLSSHSRFMPRL